MKRATSSIVVLAFGLALLHTGGCASEYTVVDRSSLVVSDNARISATSVLPGGARNAGAANHLALAQEIYQKQLDLLKERRNKVRARRRALNLLSYGTLLATGIVVGSVALAGSSNETMRYAGATALSGVGVGTGLQIGGLMQEESSAVDDKIRHLQNLYDGMLEHVRTLSEKPSSEQNDAAIGAAIESFINEALQINVKG
jgi:hypothetical protein